MPSDQKQQWHLQWVHSDGGKELNAYSWDGRRILVGQVDYSQSTVTVFMRCWRIVVGMALIGKEKAEIVYDKTNEDPASIIIEFLRSMMPAGVPFPPYLRDVDHRLRTPAVEPEPLDHGPATVARRIYSELEVPLRFQVLLQMHDLLEWAENDVYGDWCDADSRFVLETMLRELDRR